MGVDGIARFVAAAKDPTDETIGALADALRADTTLIAPFGRGTGPAAVTEVLRNTRLRGLLHGATWSEPRGDGPTATVEAVLAPGRPIAAIVSTVTLDEDDQLRRVVQEIVPAPPPDPEPLILPEAVKTAVNGALANGTPVVVAYVDDDGAPHLSLRGSTQAHGDDQLALWIRDPAGGLLRAIPNQPAVALFYRDPGQPATYTFMGRAHIDDSPATRAAVYTGTAEAERNLDPNQRGVAVVVDLDRVDGSGPTGRFRLER